MRNHYKLLTILILFVLLGAGCQKTPDSQPLGSAEDTVIETLKSAQENYKKSHDDFFQGLPTHKNIPSFSSFPDNLDAKIDKQVEKWADFANVNIELPYSIEIHKFKNDAGDKWYRIFLRKVVNGDVYTKMYDSRTNGTTDWELTFKNYE